MTDEPAGGGGRGVPPGRAKNATTRVREWIRDRVDPAERGTTQAISEQTVSWLQSDPDLLDSFLYEQIFNTTADIIRAVMGQTRQVKRFADKADEQEPERRARLKAWFDSMEHVSPDVGYVRLGAMTRTDLQLAQGERQRRVKKDATHLRWYALLERGLISEDQTVEQRYTALQVETAYKSASESVTDHLDGILQGVDETLRRILNPDNGQSKSQTNSK